MNLENKRTAVLGLGGSGKAAAMLLQRRGAQVTIFDRGFPDPETITFLQEAGIAVFTAAEEVFETFDLAVVSPGVDPRSSLFQSLRRSSTTFIGEIELAFQFCERPVVAITGTNGKTTTTQLIERMFNQAGIRTMACGNIGVPFSEAIERRNELDLFTVEVSSFQLETISSFRPKVAIWLNLTPDHLDRYQNVEEYKTAKLRIFENQLESDFAVVNSRDDIPPLAAKTIRFSAYSSLPEITLSGETIEFAGEPILNLAETNLTGLHNTENLMAALGAAFALHIPWEKAGQGLKDYQLLPHRCEKVGEVGGVTFVNDSKATNLDAMVKALESQAKPVVLIAGGKVKGFEFDSIVPLVAQKVKHAVLIGEMAERIIGSWSRVVPCSRAATLLEAVAHARSASLPGDTVLFSPGTSSFDMFKSYADRGNQFRKIIQELEGENN